VRISSAMSATDGFLARLVIGAAGRPPVSAEMSFLGGQAASHHPHVKESLPRPDHGNPAIGPADLADQRLAHQVGVALDLQ
jgi:hypothetical protein